MKKLIPVLLFILLCLGVYMLFPEKKEIQEIAEHEENPMAPNDWMYQQRSYPYEKVNRAAIKNATLKFNELKQLKNGNDQPWEAVGPTNVGGRISDIEMYDDDYNTMFVGTATGGVFKTTDRGDTWIPIFDEASSLSIGDLALAPSDKNTIYVGTGEPNAGGGSITYDGFGVYKSSDGGNNWTHIGLDNVGSIGRIVVHPTNPSIVYVAAMGYLFEESSSKGIYRSEDGGESWEKVLYISTKTGGIDIDINPQNPDILYAAMWQRTRTTTGRDYGGPECGIYQTTDGGDNWTQLNNGLPSSNEGRIGLSICDSVPNIVYAIYADRSGDFLGIYKTTNGGASWTASNDSGLSNSFSSYGWWFGRISVDPTDPDIAYLIGFNLYRTTDGGASWTYVSRGVHVDHHSLFVHPASNSYIVNGNDGGVYISYDYGDDFDHIKDMPITQYYTCAFDFQNPERIYGGTQDNGTNRTFYGQNDGWSRILGGDGFVVHIDPTDNRYIYGESQYGNISRSTNGGSRFSSAVNGIYGSKNWNTPFILDPNTPSTLYYGSNYVFKSTNRAQSWTAISGSLTNRTITTISKSELDDELLFVGTEDGRVYKTTNDGGNWTRIDGDLPNRWVTSVLADPYDQDVVYATFSGYRYNEYLPHVFKSEDQGNTWIDISSNLPEAPVNDILVDFMDPNILYLANDQSVFISRDGGGYWEILGQDLPLVPILDLKIHEPSKTMLAATFGRSMFTYDLSTQITGSSHTATESTQELFVFPNPVLDRGKISIALNQSDAGTIQILDHTGKLVKSIKNVQLRSGTNHLPLLGKDFKPGAYTAVWNGNNQQLTNSFVISH